MYFSTNRGSCEQNSERKLSVCVNVKGMERKVLKTFFPQFFFFCLFFVTIQGKTVYYPPLRKDSPACHCQGNCWGDNDCVIKNG